MHEVSYRHFAPKCLIGYQFKVAHYQVSYLYLRRYPFETALTRIREKIKAHNLAHNLPDSPTSGYHETMTQAWMRLVYLTLCEYGPAETADGFYGQNPQLSEKKILRMRLGGHV